MHYSNDSNLVISKWLCIYWYNILQSLKPLPFFYFYTVIWMLYIIQASNIAKSIFIEYHKKTYVTFDE